jgi:hypothetical protein
VCITTGNAWLRRPDIDTRRSNGYRHRDTTRGDHTSLMAAGGSYAVLFHLQAQGYRDDMLLESEH